MLRKTVTDDPDTSWQQRLLVLPLAAFDDTKFEWIEDAWEALDVRICDLTALARRAPCTQTASSRWRSQLATMFAEINLPTIAHEQIVQQLGQAPRASERWFVAVNACNEFVGVTILARHPFASSTCCIRLTGVVPAYRRQQMATVLKVHALRTARLANIRFVETYADNNLLELNLRLGFRPKSA